MLIDLAKKVQVVFPVHPRTRASLEAHGLIDKLTGAEGVSCIEPLNYVRFMSLVFNCRLVLTDSGGIQEETTYLGIPCLTLRDNTERPVTVTEGSNRLCKVGNVRDHIARALSGAGTGAQKPELWDGQTAQRVVAHIEELLSV